MNDLREQIEAMRQQMLETRPALMDGLHQLEQHLLHEHRTTVEHIQHVRALRKQTAAILRSELEALRETLLPTHTPPPIPVQAQTVPPLEERFSPPRFLTEAAE